MTDDNADRSVLDESLKCRVPKIDQGMSISGKAEALSDHILKTSLVRADLAALRMSAHVELRQARREWRKLTGWETYRQRGDRTKSGEDAAKGLANPALADRIEDAEWVIARCSEEMERLDKDATRCNQGHDILTGNG